jgi:rubrerythrin
MAKSKEEEKETLYWQCCGCNYVVQEQTPPEHCPSCLEKCTFRNVTCYSPDCGCQGVDPKLVKK